MIDIAEVDTPVGPLRVGVRDGRVCALAFADRWEHILPSVQRRFPGEDIASSRDQTVAVTESIEGWLHGDLAALDGVEVDLGGTPFQRRVWDELRRIPAGQTASYGEVAAAVGAPRAARAVGTANAANPVWLVVPCHRVVRSSGDIGGYGGGTDRKRWLLHHELLVRSLTVAHSGGHP